MVSSKRRSWKGGSARLPCPATGTPHQTSFAAASLQAIEQHVIRNLSFEWALLLLNDYPDPKVSVLLEPGLSNGWTNVLFDGATLNVNGIIGDHPAQLQFQALSYAAPWVSM